MDNKHIKCFFALFGEQLIFDFLSLFFLSICPWALNGGMWKIIYTVVIGLIYLSSIYTYSWRISAKDYRTYKSTKKREPDSDIKYRIYTGFVYSGGILAVNIILLIAALNTGMIFNAVYRILNFSFMGLIIDDNNKISVLGGIIAAILPVIASGIGYIAGRYDFSITEKYLSNIVYKKKPVKKSN